MRLQPRRRIEDPTPHTQQHLTPSDKKKAFNHLRLSNCGVTTKDNLQVLSGFSADHSEFSSNERTWLYTAGNSAVIHRPAKQRWSANGFDS